MGVESLGTAALNLTVDTRGIEVGIDRAKSKVAGLSNAAQKEFQALDAATKRSTISLSKQADTFGMTKAEALAYNITLKTSGAIQQELLAKVNATNAAVKKGGIEFNQYGLSAKQTSAALRQVPAQLTDIVVSLQGGQKPLTVLLQQGGQLKDVFGGVVPAVKALGGAVLDLINPWTLAAAAVGLFVFALNDAQSRQSDLANSLVLTGNAATTTTEQLQALAKTLDDTTAASERHASAVVAQVSATGRFTLEQVRQVSQAALEMEEATGRSIAQTVADFAAIGDDPVNAIQKLNNAIGDGTNVINFLTAEQVKQITEMERQGDTAGATKILFDAYFDAINDRTPQVTANLSTMSVAWKNMKDNIGDATDGVVNFFNEFLKAENLRNNFGFQDSFSPLSFINSPQFDVPVKPRAPASAIVPVVTKAQQDAAKAFQAEVKTNLSDEARQREEINRITNQGTVALKAGLITLKQYNDALANSKARFDEAQARKNKSGAGAALALDNAATKKDLAELKNALAVEQASIQQGTQILQANFAARNVSAQDYFAKQKGYIEEGQAAEEKALAGQIAILQSRNVQGKTAVDVLRQISELEAQLAKVRAEGSTKLALLTIQEQDFYEKRNNAIEDYRDRLIESNAALQIQTSAAIARIGLGTQEAEQQERINEIYVNQALAVAELNKQLARHEIDQATFDADIAAQQAATDTEVQIVTDGFQRMLAAQADWHNGFKKGLADWLTGTADVASQISQITNKSLQSASDALANFALTGKLEIKQLLASILTDIVKFLAQRAIMQFIMAFLPGSLSSPGTNFGIPLLGSGGGSFFHATGTSFPGSTTLPLNSVLTKPTLFRYANGGSFGVAGEAGPEGVLPLKRGADGKLGVRLYGGGSASMVNIKVETHVHSDGATSKTTSEGQDAALYKEFTGIMERTAQQTIMKEMRPGGSLHRAGVKA